MSKESIKRVHLIYGIVLSVLLCVVGALFIIMCLDIYKSGPSPFTRDSIGEHFARIAVFVYILIALVIGGIVLNIALPLESKKVKGKVSDALVLDKLRRKLTSVSQDAQAKIEKQRIIRLVMIIISALLITAASITSFILVIKGFDASSENSNGQVLGATLTVLRYFAVPLIYLIVTTFVCKYSIKRELEIVKSELKSPAEENAPLGTFTKLSYELNEAVQELSKPKKWHKYASLAIKCVVGCVAIVFIILGITNGGMQRVLEDAIKICTSCIGMG